MSFEIEVARVKSLHCVVEDHDWEFDSRHGAEIDAHWSKRTAANPSLYDGPALLAHRVERTPSSNGSATFSVKFFPTRFSRFVAWRDFGFPGSGVYNCFSMPALRSADGAFMLGEMGPTHSVPGAVYFPAGTPDPDDVRDGSVDLEANLFRELFEETGIRPENVRLEPEWTIVFAGPRIACIRVAEADEPAAAIEARVADYLARQKEPELARVHMVRRRSQLVELRALDFIRRYLEPLLPE